MAIEFSPVGFDWKGVWGKCLGWLKCFIYGLGGVPLEYIPLAKTHTSEHLKCAYYTLILKLHNFHKVKEKQQQFQASWLLMNCLF